VVQRAVGDTGLARPDYYNWPASLRAELTPYRPEIVVVFLGGDDAQSFVDNGQVVAYGTTRWRTDYAARVGALMSEATLAGAHVMWVGMPIMANPTFSGEMQQLNTIYAQEASAHAGVVYFPSWGVFTDTGAFSPYLADGSGDEVLVRNPDGVHLTNAGDDRLAQALARSMEVVWHVDLRG